jgi:hypothetical protein
LLGHPRREQRGGVEILRRQRRQVDDDLLLQAIAVEGRLQAHAVADQRHERAHRAAEAVGGRDAGRELVGEPGLAIDVHAVGRAGEPDRELHRRPPGGVRNPDRGAVDDRLPGQEREADHVRPIAVVAALLRHREQVGPGRQRASSASSLVI